MAAQTRTIDYAAKRARMWSREHAKWSDQRESMEKYVAENPDDAWAAGQLRHIKKRMLWLEERIGLAINREPSTP